MTGVLNDNVNFVTIGHVSCDDRIDVWFEPLMNIKDSFAKGDSFGGAEKVSVVLECCATSS
jgi:hypothetical protein